MRSALLALAILAPMPAMADGHELMPSLDGAFAIRECRDHFVNGPVPEGAMVKNVCYQEIVSRSWDLTRPDKLFTVTRERTRQLKCNRPYLGSSLRAKVGAKYCPDTTLDVAPFLR